MMRQRANWLGPASILAGVVVISAFHYTTSTEHRYLHEIYQRVYYVPILLAAFWYGPVGGVGTALLTSGLYLYHIQRDWHHVPMYTFNQYAEICLYHAIGLLVGVLSSRERRQRKDLERTSRRLSEAYESLQKTFEHLRRADRLASMGRLSAGIAHEIRNPLGTIKGSIEILSEEFPADHPKREFLGIVHQEIARLNAIVEDFLRFGRPPQPSIQPTPVGELLDSTVTLLQKPARDARIRIRIFDDPQVPPVPMDPDQIRQVMLNVMLNGLEAMPDGGVLEARVFRAPESRRVAIEISDNGSGSEGVDMERIFDPFYTTKAEGTGLGLSICFQLVKNHGGTISARANEDRGLTFRIELPLEEL